MQGFCGGKGRNKTLQKPNNKNTDAKVQNELIKNITIR